MSRDPLDEFAPESFRDHYSPDNIVATAGDPDHAKRVRGPDYPIRTPSYLQVMINMVVAEIPEYNSAADFLRDAAYHRIHYWRNRLKNGESDVKIREWEAVARFRSNMAINSHYESQLAEMDKLLRDAKHPTIKKQLLAAIEDVASETVEEHWANEYRELIRRNS